MAHRVFMHVGTPKTGTTFLQQVLWSQRDVAREHGLVLPGRRFNDHWLACMDVRGKTEGRPQAVGAWQRLLGQVEQAQDDVLVSHELFAGADAAQVGTVVRDLGVRADEVHVVVTARDLVRQIPAEWQQHLKERATSLTLDEFVESIRRRDVPSRWFWRVQDVPALVSRWLEHVPADRVHVVTVPPSGSPPDVLWGRFADVLGVPAEDYDLTVKRANQSIGLEQAEALRRLVAELGDRLGSRGAYATLVKDQLVNDGLSTRPGTRLELRAEELDFAVAASREMARALGELGVDVVGDLRELAPEPTRAEQEPLRAVTAEAVLAEVVWGLALVLDQHDRARRRLDAVLQELGDDAPAAGGGGVSLTRRAVRSASARWAWVDRARLAYHRRAQR